MIVEGGILGGTYHFMGDPYLNSTTILFDYTTCTSIICDRACNNRACGHMIFTYFFHTFIIHNVLNHYAMVLQFSALSKHFIGIMMQVTECRNTIPVLRYDL